MERLRLPDALTADEFLARHWQKSPLYLRGATDRIEPGLSPDEIAWLATLEDVESRLVFTGRSAGGTTYRLEHGPFTEDRLASLPGRDWTLLVQDVEKHLPELRSLYRMVDFIPDWRIDDLMVSVAAPGGSVGPHRDSYDVFLCQAIGSREWRLQSPDCEIERLAHPDLSLLEPFDAERVIVADVGDVLYLPPAVPHWGIARGLTVTWSIGMRAPQYRDFERTFERLFGNAGRSPQTDDEAFYRDPDLSSAESAPGWISPQALHRLRRCFPPAAGLDEGDAAKLIGATVTEPKPALAPEPLADEDARGLLARHVGDGLAVHGMAHLAWYRLTDCALLFANASIYRIPLLQLDLIKQMCAERIVGGGALENLTSQPAGIELVHRLLATGVLVEVAEGDG